MLSGSRGANKFVGAFGDRNNFARGAQLSRPERVSVGLTRL